MDRKQLCLRKVECKLCPLTTFTLYLDIAPMRPDDAARDSEPQSRASAACARSRSIASIEPLKDMREILRAYTFAGIADGHVHA